VSLNGFGVVFSVRREKEETRSPIRKRDPPKGVAQRKSGKGEEGRGLKKDFRVGVRRELLSL